MKKLFNKYYNKYYWICISMLLIIGIVCAASLTNCSEPAIKIGTTGTDRILEGCNFENIYKFKFENHDYIMFETGGVNSRVAGIVHSPECKYCEKYCKTKHIENEQTKSSISTSNSIP